MFAAEVLTSFLAAFVPTAGTTALAWIAVSRPAESQAVARGMFLWGAFVAAPAAFLGGRWLLEAIPGAVPGSWARVAVALLVAPWLEEGLKAAGLQIRTRLLPDSPAGVVSGLAIGMGFALAENFLALLEAAHGDRWLETAMLRTVGSAAMHALAGATLGFGGGRGVRGIVAFAGAVGIHALWNGLALAAVASGRAELTMVAGAAFWLLAGLVCLSRVR